jgi:predicted alpha/beta superfamily hydrolase
VTFAVHVPEAQLHGLGPFDIPGVASQRWVRVYAPSTRPKKKPPQLLVLFDGQNVFDDAPAFAGGWRVHEKLERMRSRAPLVLAIEHGGPARIDELSPWRKLTSLVDWIARDLVPPAIQRFGLAPAPHGVIIGGSSMGGLAALYALLSRPDVFGGAICMSPSLWLERGRIADEVARHGVRRDARIYLDAGRKEPPGMVRGVERMGDLLRAHGATLNLRIDPRGHHAESSWRRRFPAAWRYVSL